MGVKDALVGGGGRGGVVVKGEERAGRRVREVHGAGVRGEADGVGDGEGGEEGGGVGRGVGEEVEGAWGGG